MPQRLTPAGAAAIVDGKLKAQEEAAEAERASAAQRAVEARAWQAQARKLITAACEGHSELVISKHPVKTPELRRLGFRILKEVEADDLSEREALERHLSEISGKQSEALSRLNLAVSRWTEELIDRPLKRDLEREISSLLRAYKYKPITKILEPDFLDSQFDDVEVGEIIQDAIESGWVSDWLSLKAHVKEINLELSQIRTYQSEQRKVKSRLAPFDGAPRMVDKELTDEEDVLSTEPPFKISWPLIRGARHWVNSPLVSAPSLSWIANSGQLMLEAIESIVSEAANSMQKSVELEVRYTNRHEHILAQDGSEIVHFPPPDELIQTLSAVGWNPRVSSRKNGDYTLKLNW